MANGEVKIVLLAQDQASKTIKSLGASMKASLGDVSKYATVAGLGIAAFAGKAIADFSEAEAAQKQLEHATLAVAGGTREQLKALQDLSNELEKKGVLDGDSIATGLAQLQTFGLSAEMTRKLGGSLADLAVNQYGVNASSEELTASANMIAKALNGQFGALEKSGIRFTDAQKAMIQYGTETQKTAAIQEGFAQNLKYTNEVAAGTTEGAMARLKVQIGNVSEAVGGALAPALVSLVDKIQPVVEKVSAWAAENPELISKIFMVAGGVTALLAVLAPLVAAITTLIPVFAFLVSPIGLVAVAIGLLIAAIGLLIANWDKIGPKVAEVWASVVSTVTTFSGQVAATLQAWGEAALKFFTDMWEGAKNIFTTGAYFLIGVVNFLSEILLGVSIPQIIMGFQIGWKVLVDSVVGLTQGMAEVVLVIWEGIKMGVSLLFEGISAIFTFFTAPLIALWNGIWGGLIEAFNAITGAIKEPIQSLFDWLGGLFNGIKNIIGDIANVAGQIASTVARATVKSGKNVVSGTRAMGGPVSSGNAYLVGENGPEIFSPYGSGTIVPNSRVGGLNGGVSVQISVGNVSSDLDMNKLGRIVGDQIMRTLKQNQLIGA